MLDDFDFESFWEPSDYADQNYVDDPIDTREGERGRGRVRRCPPQNVR
jgi:hypothetical protein